jgi:putative transposase
MRKQKKVQGKRRKRTQRQPKPLETIWEVPDSLWQRVEPILLEFFPPAWTGRPREDWRQIFNGIIYQFRTGCQWNHIPEEFGDDSTIHRWFTKWCQAGALQEVWRRLAAECDELGAVLWEWQAADSWQGKARMGGDLVGENPTDRAKNGTKKSVAVDQEGGPLGVILAPSNRHESKLLRKTLEAIVLDRPKPTKNHPQHLCLDKAYDTENAQKAVADEGYVSHTARIDRGEWVPTDPKRYRQYLKKRAA